MADQGDVKGADFSFTPQSRVDEYYGNETGKKTQAWYYRGADKVIAKWAKELGSVEAARQAYDDAIRWENLYSANRGVDEAAEMGIRGMQNHNLGIDDFPNPMDVNTKKGQTWRDSAALQTTREGGMTGGPKLGPFGDSKRAGVNPEIQPKKTVADRIEH